MGHLAASYWLLRGVAAVICYLLFAIGALAWLALENGYLLLVIARRCRGYLLFVIGYWGTALGKFDGLTV